MADVIDLRGSATWIKKLARDNNKVLPSLSNAMIILANDPVLSGMLGYDEFVSTSLIMRAPPPPDDGEITMPGPYPRMWQEEDSAMVLAYLQCAYNHRFNRTTIEEAMTAEASLRRFHPVRDWLAGLIWDGRQRIDRWLVNAFRCDDTPYHWAIGAKLLIAAVRRVRRPGVKFDHLPVLEGAQGIGKSTSLRNLFGPQWFSDAMPADLGSRDAAMALLGIWGMEFSEIDVLIRSEVETVKAFLSRPIDRFRRPWGRHFEERPRQGIPIGTTNSTDYLRDSTGNRRIWPIRCRTAEPAWIAEVRDQLWAEAAAREATGEAIWLDDEDVRQEAAQAQAERMAEDVWSDAIAGWIRDGSRSAFSMSDVLNGPLAIPRERQDRRAQLRAASVLRQLGWDNMPRYDPSLHKTVRMWRRLEPEPTMGTLL